MKQEPVVTANTISGIILAIIVFLVGRQALDWSEQDISNFKEILVYGAPLLVGIISVAAAFVARQWTTSLANPRNNDMKPLMTKEEWEAEEAAPSWASKGPGPSQANRK